VTASTVRPTTSATSATSTPSGPSAGAVLAVDGLSAGYGGSIVVSGTSLRVEAGQVACLMGRNGVGKTTLLKTVMGVVPARAGTITLDGRDLTRRPIHERARAGIGYVPQGRGVFPYLSVRENLLMGLEAAADGRTEAEQRLDEQFTRFPVLRTMQQRLAGTLSGGQQQQMAIARALIGRPALLLLDEPTEGIQPSIVDEIEGLLRELRSSRTVSILLVEQFLDFALGLADYCYVMEKGTIVSRGTAETLSQDVVREHLSV
jgi:urea transport system ATP-binding protein